MQSNVKLGSGTFGNNLKLSLIAGPCVLESHSHARKMVEKLLNINEKLNVNFTYNTSFDKANRTSLSGVRGLGLDESLKIFSELKNEYKIKLLTDVHTEEQCSLVSEYVDIIQIPAFLCRQTDLLISAAKTNKVINVKKGQFLAPWDMKNVVKKVESSDNTNILITERGTSFGYSWRPWHDPRGHLGRRREGTSTLQARVVGYWLRAFQNTAAASGRARGSV